MADGGRLLGDPSETADEVGGDAEANRSEVAMNDDEVELEVRVAQCQLCDGE